jgi:ABC-2 type transport system permease protein
MKHLPDMIWIEMRKALRSKMPWFTAAGSVIMPLGIAFLIFVATKPEVAGRLGLVGAKANLVAYANTGWPTYLGFQTQMIAAGAFFLFCLIISWVFGREFVDGTLKDMMAVPVPRASIVLAKFAVVAAWSAAVAVLIYATGLITGALMRLPGASPGVLLHGSLTVAVTACLTLALAFPFAFFASVGRGYLLPIGLVLLAVMLANLAIVLGWGAYFPWAVPGLYAQGKSDVEPVSYAVVILTGAAGIWGTHLWWKYADQNR